MHDEACRLGLHGNQRTNIGSAKQGRRRRRAGVVVRGWILHLHIATFLNFKAMQVGVTARHNRRSKAAGEHSAGAHQRAGSALSQRLTLRQRQKAWHKRKATS
jgi:hypothetical protein